MKEFKIYVLWWADMLVRFAFFTMQNYLTDVWKLTVTHAAGFLNVWEGICNILPVFLGFVADQFLGHLMMLAISSIAHSLGIGVVVMSISPVLANSTGSCKECIDHTQKVAFFIGMSLLAVGLAGNRVSVDSCVDEQIQNQPSGYWWTAVIAHLKLIAATIVVLLIPVIGIFGFPYIKSWTFRFGIPAISSAVATLLFFSGWRDYDKPKRQGSPLANVCRDFVASFLKRSKPLPSDPQQFYRRDPSEPQLFSRTRFLGFLHKAAIILPDEVGTDGRVKSKWKLRSVEEVEEAKIIVRMIPVWLTFIVSGIVSSIGNSYFSEQANNMNRNIGKWKVPGPLLYMLYGLVKFGIGICASFLTSQDDPPRNPSRIRHDSESSTAAARFLKDRNYRPAIGIGIGMVFSVLCCITAAKIETKRLRVIRKHRLVDKPDEDIPMNAAWLIFQFILLAGLDSFLAESVDEFHRREGPKSIIRYVNHLANGVRGIGYMCGVVSVYVVGKVSQIGGRGNWFQQSLNESRLDRYYWVLAALSSVNLVVYIGVASTYSYHKSEPQKEEINVETEV